MLRFPRIMLLLLIVFSTVTALAQSGSSDKARAFKGGEKLRYVANYKIGFMNVDVATVDFTVKEEVKDGINSYKINALAKMLPQYNYFFELKDDYYVWLDRTTLKPFYFENFIKEGSYTLESYYKYDWLKMKVKTYENRPVWDSPKIREFEIFQNSLDGLSLFYNLRNIPLEKLKVGVVDTLNVVFANKIRRIAYRYIGKESMRIKGLGKVNTVKFICQLANASGVSFEDGSEFELWLSDDQNRIPLYINTPIKVGSVRGRLIDYEGLMIPFTKN